MKFQKLLIFVLLLGNFKEAKSQNQWQPDSTAYNYLSRGNNLEQYKSSGLTTISKDLTIHNANSSSIKWDIPANSGNVVLTLLTGDIDLSNTVLYSVCRRNNIPNSITINVNTINNTSFIIGPTTKVSTNNFALPVTEWHQLGSFISSQPKNNANPLDLEHVKSITFEAPNANVNVSLWIDEIKTIKPTGPACIIHFNRFRSNADSLLVPYLLQKNIKANIDFVFAFAKSKLTETKSGLTYSYVGLNRIDTLVHQYGWSCTSHGSFYDNLPYLSATDQYKLCALDSFINHGFDAKWCFSIPVDDCTNDIFKKIKDWNFYKSIRKQDQGYNELPINNPYNVKFFRPTSASAGSNVGGTPLTPQQMKSFVDKIQVNKGLLVIDFGSILTDSSNLFQESELTMQNDALGLINYADSLNIPFITFEDLFKPDSNYIQKLHSSDDYFVLNDLNPRLLDIQSNDVAPNNSALIVNIIQAPIYGIATVSTSQINYTPSSICFTTDTLIYTLSDSVSIDTSKVFIQRMGSNINVVKTGYCNPNTYSLNVTPRGGLGPYNYLWQDGNINQTRIISGSDTLFVIITDASGCTCTDSITIPNIPFPDPVVLDSIQCGPGIPLCTVTSNGTTLWYDSLAVGSLLQTGGSTFSQSVNSSTTFYVAVDYGSCISNRIAVSTTFKKPVVQITSSDTLICSNQFVRLNAINDVGLSYHWFKNGTAIANGSTSNFYFARRTGTYSLKVTRDYDGCINNSNSINISVIDTPFISTNDSLVFCLGDSITLNMPVILNATYSWYQNNSPIINAISSQLIVYSGGTYNGIVNYPQGCSISTDTVTTQTNCNVGIEEPLKDFLNLSIFPNPSSGVVLLILENKKPQHLLITVTNILGEVISTITNKEISAGTFKYSLAENLPPEVYFCNVKTESELHQVKFIIIK